MKKRSAFLTLLFCCAVLTTLANMGPPWRGGTNSARPFLNAHVDILKEELTIRPDRNFRTALYDIRYHISAKKDGIAIPLLFIALDKNSDFRIEVDGKEVALLDIPGDYTTDHPGFQDFRYFFEKADDGNERVQVKDTQNGGRLYALSHLKYFHVDLSKGAHVIHVSYTAFPWEDLSDGWVKTYDFRYALSPASYWKSFGKLYLTIDASACKHPLKLLLDRHTEIQPGAIVRQTLNGIPSEMLRLSYEPTITGFPAFLLSVGPFPIALAIGIPLLICYFLLIRLLCRRNPGRSLRLFIVGGGAVISFAFVYSWIYAYDRIDHALGQHSANYHGYGTIGIFLLLPVLLFALPAVGFARKRSLERKDERPAGKLPTT